MAKPTIGDLIPLGSDNNYTDADKAKVDAIPENPEYTDTKYTAGDNITISDNVISATDTDTITTINGKTGAIAKADIVALGIPGQDTTYTAGTNIEINSGAINNIITDQGTDPDWVGVKYKWVMIDGELFAEVVSV